MPLFITYTKLKALFGFCETVSGVSNAGNVSLLRNKVAIKKSENLFQFCIK